MISAFVERKRWPTALIALVLGPAVGMLYLGQGRKAIAYLVIGAIGLIVSYQIVQYTGADIRDTKAFVAVPIHLFGLVHCLRVAKGISGNPPKVWFSRWLAIVALLLILPIGPALLIRALVWEPFHSPAGSMLPELQVDDEFLVSKYAYGYSRHSSWLFFPLPSNRLFEKMPERGDVVVFKLPSDISIDYVKRVIGLPGDRIQMIDGILYLNGKEVVRKQEDDYEYSMSLGRTKTLKRYTELLPNGISYEILEENNSSPLDNTDLFTVRAGQFFAMGDNRDNSQDSRVFGMVPFDNLVGKYVLKYWDGKTNSLVFEVR